MKLNRPDLVVKKYKKTREDYHYKVLFVTNIILIILVIILKILEVSGKWV